MYPSVKSLQVHLENMQTVGFREDTNLLSILHNQQASKTMLTEYFQMNQLDKDACRFVYKEFPEYYVWNEDKKYWSQRKQRNAIGRLTAASPVEGERYYLRLLLNHVNGATSYQSLQTVNGIKFDIFRKAAEQFGLHESDNNIDQYLEEASLFQMTFTLRRLFLHFWSIVECIILQHYGTNIKMQCLKILQKQTSCLQGTLRQKHCKVSITSLNQWVKVLLSMLYQ